MPVSQPGQHDPPVKAMVCLRERRSQPARSHRTHEIPSNSADGDEHEPAHACLGVPRREGPGCLGLSVPCAIGLWMHVGGSSYTDLRSVNARKQRLRGTDAAIVTIQDGGTVALSLRHASSDQIRRAAPQSGHRVRALGAMLNQVMAGDSPMIMPEEKKALMKLTETAIAGAWRIEIEPHSDERGFFARSFCQREFASLGLNDRVAQCNVSFNERAGTLRGMHYQRAPSAEAKLVRCTRGRLWDVIVDLRQDSPSFLQWIGVELTAQQRNALYVPEGCAHGFQTLEDETEVFYQMSEFYAPELARGFCWDDPRFGIEWPLEPTCLSDQDRSLPSYRPDSDDV